MPVTRLKTGIDLIEIERFEAAVRRHGARFLGRVFTQNELAEVGENLPSLAARFAGKEAVAKALGPGIGAVAWREIEILRGPLREPALFLHGAARRLSEQQALTTWSISLSHTHTHATAIAVALAE